MHPACKAVDRREYFRDRPSRRRTAEERLRPALWGLVRQLNSRRGRADMWAFLAWAERALREELRTTVGSTTGSVIQRHQDVVAVLSATLTKAEQARLPEPTDTGTDPANS